MIALAAQTYRGNNDPTTWPAAADKTYPGYDTGHRAMHPHDEGLILGGYNALTSGAYEAIVD